MKKIIFSVLALAALASCVKEQTLETLEPAKIEFSGAFVENATKADPSTTTANISEFSVWGVIDNETGIVLKDETVSKSGTNWTYTNTQYWTPNHQYYFSAISGDRSNSQIVIDWASADKTGMSVEGLGTMTFTNVDGTNDVLYAENNDIQTPDMEALQDAPAKVKFQFEHLLSKVQFTFTNGFVNKNNTIVVKNITMDVPKVGKVDLTADFSEKFSWTDHTDNTELAMGHVAEGARVAAGQSASSDDSRLTIPAGADKEYEVEFDVELYMGEVLASSAHKTVKISGYEFVSGHSYNFKATINQDNVDDNPLFPIEFEVEVDEWIEEDIEGETVANTYVVYNAQELQSILDENTANPENINILFGDNIKGNVTVPENANCVTRINGQENKFEGSFFINGKSSYAASTTVFENINFETSDVSSFTGEAFIYCGEGRGTDYRYPNNVTIKNCTFKATGAAEKGAVAAKFWSLKGNLIVEGGSASGLHSFLQLTSCDETNLVVDGLTISNSKNGISLDNTGKTTIKNSSITANEYGIRANSDRSAANTNIVSTTINAKQPVIVRKVKVAGYVLNIDEASDLVTDEIYDVIFTTGSDDAEYVAPTVGFTYNVPARYNVFPLAEGASVIVYTQAQLEAVLKAGASIKLGAGKYSLDTCPANVTFIGAEDGVALNVEDKSFHLNGGNVTFENVTLEFSNNNYKGFQHAGIATFTDCTIVGQPFLYGSEANFIGCKFEQTSANAYNVWTYGAANVNFTDCKFNSAGKSVLIYTETGPGQNVTFVDCELNATAKAAGKAAIEVDSSLINGTYNVTINNTTATGFDNGNVSGNSLWNQKKGNNSNITVDGVPVAIAGAVLVSDAEALAEALKATSKNIKVVLQDNIDLPISSLGQITGGSGEYKLGGESTENITIDLNGKTLNVTTTYWSNLGAKNDNALFTIKNGTMTSSQATGTWNSYDLCFSNCNYVFENVVFEKAIALGSANKSFTLNNVTINEGHDYYAMWIEAVGQIVNIDGLTINSEGRGIKIDEQYVDSPAKVTMNVKDATFETAKKAAIMVKSAAGAEINVTSIDITKVTADQTCAVWCDADAAAYAGLITVNGANWKVED